MTVSLLFFLHGAQKFFGWISGVDGAEQVASDVQECRDTRLSAK
jgi:uncharacterized membrane protein YphA (DoxX/SURF4 family)